MGRARLLVYLLHGDSVRPVSAMLVFLYPPDLSDACIVRYTPAYSLAQLYEKNLTSSPMKRYKTAKRQDEQQTRQKKITLFFLTSKLRARGSNVVSTLARPMSVITARLMWRNTVGNTAVFQTRTSDTRRCEKHAARSFRVPVF